jgi:hypothetical protein
MVGKSTLGRSLTEARDNRQYQTARSDHDQRGHHRALNKEIGNAHKLIPTSFLSHTTGLCLPTLRPLALL